jgi:hypothetical protein
MPQEARLEYAPRPPMYRRKRFRRVVIVSSVLFAVASYFWGPGVWHRVQIMYWQNRCLNYTARPNHVVLEMTGDGHEQSDPEDSPWTHYAQLTNGPKESPAFLHEMHRPDGAARLVVVGAFHGGLFGDDLAFHAGILSHASFARPMAWCGEGESSLLATGFRPFKVFAGQLDPANPSHLTIDYELDGRRFIMDGWLDNNDQLSLDYRVKDATTSP